MKIWFRVGMEAEISEKEAEILFAGDEVAHKLMRDIISRANISGETYIPAGDDIALTNNPENDVDFYLK